MHSSPRRLVLFLPLLLCSILLSGTPSQVRAEGREAGAAATVPEGQSRQGGGKSFRASDGASIDAVLTALYGCISGPAGQERDWKRFRALFIPEARLEAVIWRGKGSLSLRVFTVDEYIRTAGGYLKEHGFFEKEIARKVDRFGAIAQVFSTYEAFDAAGSAVPMKRGINSVQLYHDGGRWWIVSILWDDERAGLQIPDEYLPG